MENEGKSHHKAGIYDIAVIGAGPAGSTFARLAPGDLKIALIDKRNLDEQENFIRTKCCGGLLAPAAQKELAKQGLGLPETVLRGPQTFSVKSIDLDNDLVRFYQRHYINMDRELFDRWLVSLVPKTIDGYFGHLMASYKSEAGHFVIELKKNGRTREIEAGMIVAADGAGSAIRRREHQGNDVPIYVSIQDTYPNEETLSCYFSIFDRSSTDFYAWMIQKGDHIFFGSALPQGKDTVKIHDGLSVKLNEMGILKGNPVERNGSLISRPVKKSHIAKSGKGIFFIGEAAGFISPSSGEGISYALKSGRKLAYSLRKGKGRNGKYHGYTGSIRINLMYKGIKSKIMYNRFLRKIIMLSGIFSIKVEENNPNGKGKRI